MAGPNALYRQWRAGARKRRNATALCEVMTGRRWSFRELAEEVHQGQAPAQGRIGYPEGLGADFVIHLLRLWRDGLVSCPIEAGAAKPFFRRLPAGCAHLKVTSATTGAPRVVAFTAAQLRADVAQIMASMSLKPAWANVAAISLAHSYGFSNLVLPLVVCGMPLILAGGSLPEQVRRAAALAPDIVLPGVPALWRAWYDAGAIPANIKVAISAGAPLPVSLEEEIYRRSGLKVHNFYGSTECGGIAYDASAAPRADGQYVGKPMRGVSLSVNAAGCLEVRGRNVGLTYWPKRAATLRGGVFRTRDLAEIKGNQVFLKGRAGDQINVAGRKVAPEAIERVLLKHPAVRECAVFGVPETSGGRGEIIVAAVAAKGGTLAEIRHYARRHLLAGQMPRRWWVLEQLPVNARGKVSRGVLAEAYGRRSNE